MPRAGEPGTTSVCPVSTCGVARMIERSAMMVAILCFFIVMALVQVVKPQLLWKINRPLQKPFVKDYDASEPSHAGYMMNRAVGVVVLVAAVIMLINAL